MSAGGPSIEAAIRTCKIETGWANKIQSDRFLNPDLMVCPIWNGFDTAGREVCPDSFYTKRAGCNSAEDRVVVENALRPQYSEFISLSANGITGSIYKNNNNYVTSGSRSKMLDKVNDITGNFGTQFGSNVIGCCAGSCAGNSMQVGQAQIAQAQREQGALNEGFYTNQRRNMSGF